MIISGAGVKKDDVARVSVNECGTICTNFNGSSRANLNEISTNRDDAEWRDFPSAYVNLLGIACANLSGFASTEVNEPDITYEDANAYVAVRADSSRCCTVCKDLNDLVCTYASGIPRMSINVCDIACLFLKSMGV